MRVESIRAAAIAVWCCAGLSVFFSIIAGGWQDRRCHGQTDADRNVALQQPLPRAMIYADMCDASAAVALDHHRFLVANDEDNTLRVYDRHTGGMPLARFDLSPFLKPQKKDGVDRETDVEGAAWLSGQIYWITSHGRNRKGKERPSRYRLFATKVTLKDDAIELKPVGRPCSKLLDALCDDPRLEGFDLATAASKAPKSPGGMNIEGLAATPDGRLLIGFRNPIPGAKALIVPLENPAKAIFGDKPKLGAPELIDLAGRGIRSIDYHKTLGQYVIVAGSAKSGGEFGLYLWDRAAGRPPQQVKSTTLGRLGPEAIIVYPDQAAVQILSDDGTRKIDGTDCKELTDPTKRVFRDGWVQLPTVKSGR